MSEPSDCDVLVAGGGPAGSTPAAQRRRCEAPMRRGPLVFTWFIVRMTNPAIREPFMNPRDVLRAKGAVLGVLAGGIFGRTPLWRGLLAFRFFHDATSLAMLPRALQAGWSWRALVCGVGELRDENVMVPAR